jgi:hypothetical protein
VTTREMKEGNHGNHEKGYVAEDARYSSRRGRVSVSPIISPAAPLPLW